MQAEVTFLVKTGRQAKPLGVRGKAEVGGQGDETNPHL